MSSIVPSSISRFSPELPVFLERIPIRVIDAFTIKPLDVKTIMDHTRATRGRILTVEDHYYEGRSALASSYSSSTTLCMITTNLAATSSSAWCSQGPVCHWSTFSGVLRWQVLIGSAREMQCGGICSLAEGRLTVECRQGIGFVVHFCKCESQRGRVLSDFLNWACARGALCDLDSTARPRVCEREGMGDGMEATRQRIPGIRWMLWYLTQFTSGSESGTVTTYLD